MNKRNKSATPLNILVIEDNPGDFFLIEEFIEEMFLSAKITHVVNYMDAYHLLSKEESIFDSILLDATLPDNEGIKLFTDILFLADQTPVLILTGYENLDFSIKSLSLGVSEYLLKDEINAYSLYKSILFSIERKKHIKRLEESEKRYSELFHLSPIPMWVYEVSDLKIIQVNFAAINHYGYSESEFLNMSILNLHPDLEFQDIADIHCENSNNSNQTIHHKLKSGKIIQVQIEQNYLNIDGRPCCIMLSNDITELLETQNSLLEAYNNIVEIEEKEKEKFAAELHDGLAQNLVAAKMMFSFMTYQLPILAQEPRATLLSETLQNALDECSQMIREVRPKKIIENGFYSEIEALIEKIKATGTMEVFLSKQADMDKLFAYFDLMHIYRITQELFNNSVKYSEATKCELKFTMDGNQIQLSYKDDGKGISKEVLDAKSSFISLKRRIQILSASMKFKSALNEGVDFQITIPIKKI